MLGDFDRRPPMSSTLSMVDDVDAVEAAVFDDFDAFDVTRFGPSFEPPFLMALSIEMDRLTGELAALVDCIAE